MAPKQYVIPSQAFGSGFGNTF